MKEKDKSFEESIKELESIINELESGKIDLDKSIIKYKEATKLIEFCEKKLETATKTVNKIVENGTEKDFKLEE